MFLIFLIKYVLIKRLLTMCTLQLSVRANDFFSELDTEFVSDRGKQVGEGAISR